ncbi:hypothetical protein AB0I49_03255 [Streptomyces sp. NPDC050617]|uniref:hypothetical protein n=1 Tax=Streptomyces sp. NPDC050617 TaxID=3154628 RepID=UPI00341A268A
MRRTTIGSASATALCLGLLLTGCGSGGRDGYVAAEAAGPAGDHAPASAVPPKDGVDLVPLDGDGDGKKNNSPTPGRPNPSEKTHTPGASSTPGGPTGKSTGTPQTPTAGTNSGTGGGMSSDTGKGAGTSHGSPQKPPATPNPPSSPGTPGTTPPTKPTTPPPTPAALTVSKPKRAPADHRWCEKVTVTFTNTGGSPITKGIVTFETHIIGALGIDWATIKQTRPLPAPIPAGKRKEQTWPICVDAWRVPLGMHIETQNVTANWN